MILIIQKSVQITHQHGTNSYKRVELAAFRLCLCGAKCSFGRGARRGEYFIRGGKRGDGGCGCLNAPGIGIVRTCNTDGWPPKIVTTSAPLLVRRVQCRAWQPRGRLAGVRSHGVDATSCVCVRVCVRMWVCVYVCACAV